MVCTVNEPRLRKVFVGWRGGNMIKRSAIAHVWLAIADSFFVGFFIKMVCRERPVCRSVGMQQNKKRNDTWVVPYKMLYLLCSFYPLHFLYSKHLRCLLLHPTIFIRGRRRVSGTGNRLAGCLPGRPESQHVVGCTGICTRLKISAKIPLIRVLGFLRVTGCIATCQ